MYVINSVKACFLKELLCYINGLDGTVILGDLRGALIVILTIPTSIISAYYPVSLSSNHKYNDA